MTQSRIHKQFSDLASYSSADKTAVSVRDGVLEYLGVELGLENKDKVYTVYRSPATIANAAYNMVGIPLTDNHVSLDIDPPTTDSSVTESKVIDLVDEATGSRIGIQNKLKLSESSMLMLADKKQLSLGYYADLITHSKWDFEQVDIIPHHLAVVSEGRCGSLCSFIDRKFSNPNPREGNMLKIHKMFLDAEGGVNLEQIVEMATALPDAIRKVPVDRLKKIMPALQEIMGYAKEQGVEIESEEMADEDMEEKEEILDADKSEDKEEDKEEDKPKFSDAQMKKVLDKEKAKFADSEVKRYSEVVNKARNFLDADYDFVGKSANKLMRDALATQSIDKFEDAELSVAFKLLRKQDTDYSNFGDSKPDGGLTARIKKSMEA